MTLLEALRDLTFFLLLLIAVWTLSYLAAPYLS